MGSGEGSGIKGSLLFLRIRGACDIHADRKLPPSGERLMIKERKEITHTF